MTHYPTCDCVFCGAERYAAALSAGMPMAVTITDGKAAVNFVSGDRLPPPPGYTLGPGEMGRSPRHYGPAVPAECPQCGGAAVEFSGKHCIRIQCRDCGHKGVSPENAAYRAALEDAFEDGMKEKKNEEEV